MGTSHVLLEAQWNIGGLEASECEGLEMGEHKEQRVPKVLLTQMTTAKAAILAIMNVYAGDNEKMQEKRGLFIEEALMNGIHHGSGLDPERLVLATFRVECETRIIGDKVKFTLFVEDEGPVFDMDSVPDPTAIENLDKTSGRGLFLLREYVKAHISIDPRDPSGKRMGYSYEEKVVKATPSTKDQPPGDKEGVGSPEVAF